MMRIVLLTIIWNILYAISSVFLCRFIAVTSDNLGQNVSISPVFEVSVRLSPMCQNGLSNFNKLAPRDSGDPNPNFGIVECDCDPGYVGKSANIAFLHQIFKFIS